VQHEYLEVGASQLNGERCGFTMGHGSLTQQEVSEHKVHGATLPICPRGRCAASILKSGSVATEWGTSRVHDGTWVIDPAGSLGAQGSRCDTSYLPKGALCNMNT
jgi:hypothetical protein